MSSDEKWWTNDYDDCEPADRATGNDVTDISDRPDQHQQQEAEEQQKSEPFEDEWWWRDDSNTPSDDPKPGASKF
jgi:hypothetical protein